MKNNRTILYVLVLSLLLIGLSASLAIIAPIARGKGKSMIVKTGSLALEFIDGIGVTLNNAYPGDTVHKSFIINNVGTAISFYNIELKDLYNTVVNNEIVVTLECKSYKNYGEANEEFLGTCDGVEDFPISYSKNYLEKRIMENVPIEGQATHVYDVTFKFVESEKLQNYNLNKAFSAKFDIDEFQVEYGIQGKVVDISGNPIVGGTVAIESDVKKAKIGTLGSYLILGLVEGSHDLVLYDSDGTEIARRGILILPGESNRIDDNKIIVDKYEKRAYLKIIFNDGDIELDNMAPSKLNCIFNNGATPVSGDEYTDDNGVYTYKYAYKRESTRWKPSYYNGWGVMLADKTSTDPVTEPICSSINGIPVTHLSRMFYESEATSVDLSSFDTSKVTDMGGMFDHSQATALDLSSFNTSNVTDMYGMFYSSQATSLDLSSFNTSNVTNMSRMFYNSQATSLDLSSFDTSNVTDMYGMFYNSRATSLDLSTFNTSNVTDMHAMFAGSQATALDLSSFNTSNVTNMSRMFYNSQATSLDLSSFDTSNVTDMSYMFQYSKATSLDLSSFNTSNVTNMNSMFQGAKATIGYARNSDEAAKFNATSNKPNTLVFN